MSCEDAGERMEERSFNLQKSLSFAGKQKLKLTLRITEKTQRSTEQ